MERSLTSLDWSLVQVFLAVAQEGSLSGAARRLGQSQPTLGRQVKKLEEAVAIQLFQRQPRGLVLTPAGAEILPAARRMAEALGEIALSVAGHDDRLAGTLRLTASHMVAHHILPPLLARLRAEAPQMQIELRPSDRTESLTFREADIALRMYRPEQLDIVTRKLGEVPIGIFAARSYLDRVGRPGDLDALLRCDLIGYDTSELILRGMRGLGITLRREDFALRCDDQTTYWELVRAGCGVGFGQRALGLADPALEQLMPDVPLPGLPIWIAAHESLRRTPRVALAWDSLASGLAPFIS